MPTSLISNLIKDQAGNPLAGILVAVDIAPAPAFRMDDDSEIPSRYMAKSDATGAWSIALERNSNIDPAGAVYRVTEYIPAVYGGKKVSYCQVNGNSSLHDSLVIPSTTLSTLMPYICTSTNRPLNPYVGQMIFETDTGKVLFYYGTTLLWQPDWGVAWGEVGNLTKVATPFVTSSTVLVDATGFTMTFPAVLGRRYLTVASIDITEDTTLSLASITLHDGTTQLARKDVKLSVVPWADAPEVLHRSLGDESGVKTRKVQAMVSLGTSVLTLQASATEPALISVYDIGPAANPVIT